MRLRRRTLVLLPVCVGHVLVIAIFASDNVSLRNSMMTDTEALLLIPLSREDAPMPRAPEPPPSVRSNVVRDRRSARTRQSAPGKAETPVATSAITPESPRTNWHTEAARAAGAVLQRQETNRSRRSLATWPEDHVMSPSPSAPSDVERYDDGEMQQWVNDHCYFTNREPPDRPVGIIGLPSHWGKTVEKCTTKTRPERTRDPKRSPRSDSTPP